MKYTIPLAMSVTLNVTLIGAWFFAPERQPAPDVLPVAKPLTFEPRSRVVAVPAQAAVSAASSSSRGSNQPAWQQSLQQLRDAGVPHEVLAGLVISDFEIRWQKELREFERRYQSGAVDDDQRVRFEARRDEEQERALRAALGDEGFRRWDKAHTLRDLDLVELQLSSAQTDALYRLRKDRELADRELNSALRDGTIDEAEYNQRQSTAQNEYDQQFQRVLGDERHEALQKSEEGMEGALRQKLKGLNPADSQLQVMVDAERRWNQQRAAMEGRAGQAQLQALDAARDQEYQRVLGSYDFEQLQKSQDRRYQLLTRHANTWSLSASDIDYIYSCLQHYPQTQQSLLAYLGPQRFERLQNNGLFASGGQ